MRCFLAVAVLLAGAAAASAQDATVDDVLKRFDAAKPGEKALAFYSLDWVCNLAQATERAKAENRFVLVVLNTNITAHCNFYSGHT